VNEDFSPIIERALSLPAVNIESDKVLTTGFHHETVLSIAPEIIEAVKSGKIRRFFVVAGCDAPTKGRDYYRELTLSLPEDCVLLTTSCGKFRFNDHDFGTVPGTSIPRYIDLGQCNNSGSAVKIALALADAFGCSVNDLPFSIVLSWIEQKAVSILLGLLSLGVRNIYIGPKAPDWFTSNVVGVLQQNFNLQLISGDAKADLEKMLG
jgi:hydroxylamine reductase